MQDQIKEYIFNIPYDLICTDKFEVVDILWNLIDNKVEEELGKDAYNWYTIKIIDMSRENDCVSCDIKMYIKLRISKDKFWWDLLEEAEERMRIGL